MFKKVDKEMIKRCIKDMEFYDKHMHFPNERKKISITLSWESLDKLKEKNRSREIEKLINMSIK
jgi:hypothetical protein